MPAPDPLLIVAADARELAGVPHQRLASPLDFAAHADTVSGRALLIANGAGPALAAAACTWAWQQGRYRAMLTTGFCGAVHPDLRVGDLVTAEFITNGNGGEVYRATPLPGYRSVHLRSADFVVRGTQRAYYHQRGADVVEMEAAAVARSAQEHGVPLYCLRVVSDSGADDFTLDLNRCRDTTGRFRTGAILREALRHPLTGPRDLWRLFQHSKLAAARLGKALQELPLLP